MAVQLLLEAGAAARHQASGICAPEQRHARSVQMCFQGLRPPRVQPLAQSHPKPYITERTPSGSSWALSNSPSTSSLFSNPPMASQHPRSSSPELAPRTGDKAGEELCIPKVSLGLHLCRADVCLLASAGASVGEQPSLLGGVRVQVLRVEHKV